VAALDDAVTRQSLEATTHSEQEIVFSGRVELQPCRSRDVEVSVHQLENAATKTNRPRRACSVLDLQAISP
jgi:hypothetical protein